MTNIEDIENGSDNLLEPFIGQEQEIEEQGLSNNGGLCIVFLCTFVAVCGSFEFGSCVGYSAPTQYGIMNELKLSYKEYSMFGSILTVGAMIGAITSGWIADFIGRKGTMRMSSLICIGGWLAIYLSKGSLSLNFGRLLTGYGIGVFSYVVPVFIAEITPKNLRGALTSANQLFIVTGSSLAYVMGAFVTWRTLALTGIVPCMVLLLGLCFIPESPRWLAMRGCQNEFEIALRKLRGANADISQEQAEIQDSLTILRLLPKVTIVDLFHKRNIRFIIVGVGLMVFQQFAGINGILFYSSQIFVSAGFPPSVGSILCACLQVIVTAFGASLIDKAGRRPLLMVSASGMLLGSLVTGISFLLKAHQLALDLVPILAITGIMVYMGIFSLGMGAVPWVIMSEVFPIHVKGMAGSLVTLVSWIGSWVVSYTFNFLMSWSSYGTFFLYAFVCAIAIIFIIKVVPETKGRSLEEIQASVN